MQEDKLQSAFNFLDKNGKQRLSSSDLLGLLDENKGNRFNQNEINTLTKGLDENGSGLINFE